MRSEHLFGDSESGAVDDRAAAAISVRPKAEGLFGRRRNWVSEGVLTAGVKADPAPLLSERARS